MGNPPFSAWSAGHPGVGLATHADAASGAELVVNASAGSAALDVRALAMPLTGSTTSFAAGRAPQVRRGRRRVGTP